MPGDIRPDNLFGSRLCIIDPSAHETKRMQYSAITLIMSGGLFWSLAYVMIIYRSIRDSTYGMPVIACCMNLSWEFIYLFVYPHAFPAPQRMVNAVWLPLDLIILFFIIRFGPGENGTITGRQFYLFVALCLILFPLIFIYAHQNGIYSITSSYAHNLIMSILFIGMLFKQRGIRGQSIYIAIAKMFGSLSISLLLMFVFSANRANGTATMIIMYVSVFFLDVSYAILIYRKIRERRINPWTRI